MIVTVTMNPSVDKTIFVPKIVPGDVNRVAESMLDPAGKGINVSRMLHRLGCATIAFAVAAGDLGRLAEAALQDEGVMSWFLWAPGQTRLNVTVVDRATGQSTSFYDRGPHLDQHQIDEIERRLLTWLEAAKVLVLAGSLPPGVPPDTYAHWIEKARAANAQVVLDAEGEPLRLGIQALPTLIKPNVTEAEALLGRPLPTDADVAAAAMELHHRGIEYVVISMGGQGAICAWDQQVWRALPPAVERQSAVGSGDSLVAGLAWALSNDRSIVEGLRLGVAAGAATAMTPGTHLGTREEVEELLPQVRIEPFE
jgi:1-phosphofructokinase family hexose kinase